LDPELRYLLVNEAWSRLFGMSLAEAKQRTSTHVAGRSAAEHERLIEENRRVLAGEGPIFAEAEPVTVRSGVERTFERHKAPLRDEHGAVVGLVAVLVDVTQRVLAEAESRTRRQMLQNVIDTFPHFISVRDLNGRYRMVNAALAAAHLRLFGASLLGSTPEEAANWNGTRHRVADVMERQARIDRQVLETGKPVRVDSYAFPLHDGDPTIRQQFVFPLLDPEGKVQGVLAWSEDITERLQTERVLRQSAKMEALGRLIANVSHEFNNTLQIVRGYVELAQSDIAEAELPAQGRTQILADLKQVESAVDRGSRLARQLLATSRSSDLKPERMDLNAHIQDHLAMLRMAVGEMVQVEFLPGAPLPQVLADAGMLDQVLLNLSINARDAMPQGGRVTIDTEAVAVNEAFRAGQPWAKEDRYARIGVRDTGTGMTSEVLERIFEPFFSTKGEEKGPGLGLTVVHGIVNQHNGQILVESELGKGTAFQIYLPLPASRHGA
jgi:PAS domain S-box-containing protein